MKCTWYSDWARKWKTTELWAIPKRRKRLSLFQRTRSARKISGHFEYLKNRSCGLDVTWQPVTGDLTAHL